MKLPEKVDRSVFWLWAVPLVLAHLVLGAIIASGVGGVGGLDTVALLLLAGVLAGRFKDIGWPAWIGAAFVIVSMLLIPLAVAGYAIANKLPPAQFVAIMNPVGVVVGIANLVLLAVAGSIKGKQPAAPSIAGAPVDVAPSRAPDPLMVGSAIVGAVVVIGVVASLLMSHSHAVQSSSSSVLPPIRPGTGEVGSNGLTKDTNDFLRQLSQRPLGSR